MRRIAGRSCCFVVILVIGSICFAADDPVIGRWTIVAATRQGKVERDTGSAGLCFKSNGTVEPTAKDQPDPRGKFDLDTTTDPKRITWHTENGALKGVYVVNSDRLTLHLGLPGADRPASLEPQPEDKTAWLHLIRTVAPQSEVDLSTPEAALRAFFGGMAEQDVTKSLKACIMGPTHVRYIEIQLELEKAFQNLFRAALNRFGDEGKTLIFDTPATQSLVQVDTIKPMQKDDVATWTVTKGPLYLVKTSDGWKVDLVRAFNAENVALANFVFGEIAEYVSDVANQLENGTLKTIPEFRREMRRRREQLDKKLGERM